jgi:hypothetical protein
MASPSATGSTLWQSAATAARLATRGSGKPMAAESQVLASTAISTFASASRRGISAVPNHLHHHPVKLSRGCGCGCVPAWLHPPVAAGRDRCLQVLPCGWPRATTTAWRRRRGPGAGRRAGPALPNSAAEAEGSHGKIKNRINTLATGTNAHEWRCQRHPDSQHRDHCPR